jgi:ADP-ribose pyrophosphatase YjhB (NUDIX family)
LEEHRALSECFWKNEETGDTRLSLFVGLVTAIAGGLVAMHVKASTIPENLRRPVVIGALSALLLLGVLTLLRMLIRNEATDRYKHGLDRVRQVFRDHFDDEQLLLHYSGFTTPTKEKTKEKTVWIRFGKEFEPRKFGGLAHTVVAINGLLFAALFSVWIFPKSASVHGGSYVEVIIAFLAFSVVQLLYVAYRESRAKAELKKGAPTHAGGIVYRTKNEAVEYLIVRPLENTTQWILPKGKIRDREGHAEAALREVREETGVVANLIGYVCRMEFKTKEERPAIAKLYLMEKLFTDLEDAERENRGKDWMRYSEAEKALTHPESKCALKAAEVLRLERYKWKGSGLDP